MKKSNISFIDFIIALSGAVITPKGDIADPCDVNFTRHYFGLYDLETECLKTGDNIEIDNIVQDKRNKSITVNFKNQQISDNINTYCNNNGIELKNNQFVITKNTKGVQEERKW